MNDNKLPFSIQHIHTTTFHRGLCFSQHRHNVSQLYAVLDGAVNYTCDGNTLTLKKSDFILISPGVPRSLEVTSGSGKALVVLFNDEFNLTERFLTNRLNSVQLDIARKLANVEYEKSEPHLITEMRFNYLAIDLFAPDFSKFIRQDDNFSKICLAAEKLMQANLEKLLKLDDIAKLVGVSRAGLERAFHNCFGVSVMHHYRIVRIKAARKMLAKGASISEAAYLTGFSSPQHFATVFKKEENITPSQL